MTFIIKASVGPGGKNNIHDVAKMQAAFNAIGFDRRKYPVDGKINFFGVAVQRYIEANPIRRNGGSVFPRTIEPKGQVIESLRKVLKGSPVEKLKAIGGTTILYEKTNGRNGQTNKDYLIPPFLSLPRNFMTDPTLYYSDIDVVEIPETYVNRRFIVTLSLRSVGLFWDTNSQTLTSTVPAQMKAFIQEQLRRKGSKWTYLPAQNKLGHFRLKSEPVSEIDKLIKKLGPGTGRRRIIWDELKKSYRIPPRNQILDIAGRIHAETCASTGEAGGKAINRPWADYAATVLERSLNRNVVVGEERHCDSCRTLSSIKETEAARMVDFRDRQEVIERNLDAFIRLESNDADVEHARNILKKAGANLVPIGGDAIFGVDRGVKEGLINDAKSMTELFIDVQAKWGKDNKYAKSLNLLATKANAAIAFAALLNLRAELIIKAFKDEKIQEAILKAQRDLYNIQLEYDQAELLHLQAIGDFDARLCAAWGYV